MNIGRPKFKTKRDIKEYLRDRNWVELYPDQWKEPYGLGAQMRTLLEVMSIVGIDGPRRLYRKAPHRPANQPAISIKLEV